MAVRFQGFVDVALAGPQGEVISILLKKLHKEAWEAGAGDERWFVATGVAKKEILATALAAITSARNVMVEIPDIRESQPITSMRLTHHPSHIVPTGL